MSELLTIKECTASITRLSVSADKMRTIVDGNYPSSLKYQAIIVEEELLHIISRYIEHINQLKELQVT
jgi:hypothetical protein